MSNKHGVLYIVQRFAGMQKRISGVLSALGGKGKALLAQPSFAYKSVEKLLEEITFCQSIKNPRVSGGFLI